ncbi:hypothetical protein ACO0R3_000894 [Hanseniaspora guilliermondii]
MDQNITKPDSNKNISSEGISRVASNKSYNSNGYKSNNHSAANSIYNQQTKQHQPKLVRLVVGSLLHIGNHVVEIINYLAEGGFSQIYRCKFISYLNEANIHESLKADDFVCLKRVICQNQQSLNELKLEVEVMKKFRGCDRIVDFYDSSAKRKSAFDGSDLPDDINGAFDPSSYYEVFVLMELCPNNSLLEYMNDRLLTKLSETEILNIMYDTTRAIFHMHSRGLIHKDIKIENVLVDKDWHFKLCDFGSTSKPYPIVSSPQDLAYLSQDIYVHTTPQYRSPEMIDLYKSLPIDEKSDIWALGVFLYKLLFYTTPFEMTGTFAALHSRYDIPVNNYSTKITNLIVIMLSENPSLRPNIYQVFLEVHTLTKGHNHPLPNDMIDIYQQGPYNFNKFSSYQSFVHNLQISLANSYQQKRQIDEYMYVNVFDIASKQPYNAGSYLANERVQEQGMYAGNAESINPERAKSTIQNVADASRSKNETTKSNGERLFNVSKESKSDSLSEKKKDDFFIEDADKESDVEKEPEAPESFFENEEYVSKRFPSVDDLALELENITDDGLKKIETSKSSVSSKGFNNFEVSDKNVPISISKLNVEVSNASKTASNNTGVFQRENVNPNAKKYKSNNPFPKMNSLAQDTYKNKNFSLNDDFFAYSSSPIQKNLTKQVVEKDTDFKNNNPYINTYISSNTKTGSSMTTSSLQNNNGSQNMSPFLGANVGNVPIPALNRIDESNYNTRNTSNNANVGRVRSGEKSGILSTTTTKDLIDFSELDGDHNDYMKRNVLKGKGIDADDLKKKMKQESPIISEDGSSYELGTEDGSYTTDLDQTVKDPRIKNVLQLRYTDVDLDKADDNVSEHQRGKKSLDFRRDIFTEDMDLNDSNDSMSPSPDIEHRKKHVLLTSHHKRQTSNIGAGSQKGIKNGEVVNGDNRARRSLDFEREVMRSTMRNAEQNMSNEFTAEIVDGIDKKALMDVKTKNGEKSNMSKQEKRKSLFNKLTKGF